MLEEKLDPNVYLICLRSDFERAQIILQEEKKIEEDEKNLVTIDFLSAGTRTLALIKVGGTNGYDTAIVGTGSIPGKQPEGQIKYLGRQFARLKRCQENQLTLKKE